MSSTESKQKRLTIGEKLDIIRKLDLGAKQVDLAAEYGVKQSSISFIKKNKENILGIKRKLEGVQTDYALNKKNTKLEFSAVDSALYQWFVQMRELGNPISGPLLQAKALTLNALLGGPADFKASNGWLEKWKNRHGIRQLSIQGERLSADDEMSRKFCLAFRDFVRDNNYDRNKIYNADETGLMWKQLPRKTLVTQAEKSAPGQKVSKDRVTLMVCANADGSHKIPMMMIGKAQRPRCFRKSHELPIVYKEQKSGWMDRELFKEWYLEVFLPELEKQHGPDARCLLLLDNAPSHPPAEELNMLSDLCHVMYLPPNVTALIQPMDQRVIEKTKKLFRRDLLKKLLLSNDGQNVTTFLKNWNILNVCNGIAIAWNGVTAINIKNSFKNLLGDSEIPVYEESLDTGIFTNWVHQLSGFDDITNEEVLTWLCDENDPGWKILDDEELLAVAQGLELDTASLRQKTTKTTTRMESLCHRQKHWKRLKNSKNGTKPDGKVLQMNFSFLKNTHHY